MKLVRNSVLGFVLVAVAAVAGVDPELLGLVPPDAMVISGIQVRQSKTSRFGQYVLSQMGSDDPAMKKFIADTGFDPRNDLDEIVLATAGPVDDPQVVVLGRGHFIPGQIVTAAKAAGALVSDYKGIQLLSHQDSKSDNALGFLDGTTAVMGSSAAVKAAIDRRGSAARLDAGLQMKVSNLSLVNDAWFVTTVPPGDFFSGKMADPNMGKAMGGNLFQAVRSASGGLKFSSDGILISGEALTRSDQDATALADVIRFIAGLVQQNSGTNPQAKQAATLLQSLQISTQASTLKLTLSIPEEMAEKMFVPQGGKHPRTRRTASAH